MDRRWMIGVALAALLAAGCGEERTPAPWWATVTGVAGDSLGFEDRWEISGAGRSGVGFTARVLDRDHARLDFSPAAGGYSIIYNKGRTARLKGGIYEDAPIDRTMLLTYLIPYLGGERLTSVLEMIGIDITRVTRDVAWAGHTCLRIGGSPAADSSASESELHPAIYFDQQTGAALRLVNVTESRMGTRVAEIRLFDHSRRRGAYLPTRLETWDPDELRSRLTRVSAREGSFSVPALYHIPFPS